MGLVEDFSEAGGEGCLRRWAGVKTLSPGIGRVLLAMTGEASNARSPVCGGVWL
jgi:hypothetical protein